MEKENHCLRERLRIEDIKFWELAKELGITASTFTIWMRSELSEERKERVTAAMDAIIARRKGVMK